jgi:hypothetical protein
MLNGFRLKPRPSYQALALNAVGNFSGWSFCKLRQVGKQMMVTEPAALSSVGTGISWFFSRASGCSGCRGDPLSRRTGGCQLFENAGRSRKLLRSRAVLENFFNQIIHDKTRAPAQAMDKRRYSLHRFRSFLWPYMARAANCNPAIQPSVRASSSP